MPETARQWATRRTSGAGFVIIRCKPGTNVPVAYSRSPVPVIALGYCQKGQNNGPLDTEWPKLLGVTNRRDNIVTSLMWYEIAMPASATLVRVVKSHLRSGTVISHVLLRPDNTNSSIAAFRTEARLDAQAAGTLPRMGRKRLVGTFTEPTGLWGIRLGMHLARTCNPNEARETLALMWQCADKIDQVLPADFQDISALPSDQRMQVLRAAEVYLRHSRR